MVRLKRVGILTGVILTGLLMIASYPLLGKGVLPNQHKLQDACLDANAIGPCLVIAKALPNFVNPGQRVLAPVLAQLTAEARKILNLPDTTSCPECEHNVKLLESEMSQNATLKDIDKTLGKACVDEFPDPTAEAQCEAVIHQYVPQIANTMTANLPPNVLCAKWGFCTF